MAITHDITLAISTGRARTEKHWRNTEITWGELTTRLSTSKETQETHDEYIKMTKDEQDRIKDIGGFVGGHLRNGQRSNGYVDCRQIVTLDLDNAPSDILDQIMDNFAIDYAYAIYSTHKHTPEAPRLRVIIPLNRKVTPDEYEAIARKLAEDIGIDYCDDTTYQPSRLMFWPSHSRDGDVVYKVYDADILDADEVLARYEGHWDDVSYWPTSSRVQATRRNEIKAQGDPTAKRGIVGAFCRTYDVTSAMERYLPGVYEPTSKPDRYTYAAGSSHGGLVIYQGGLFAYSNHATDPAGGQLCNAFDLVRVHKFGSLDADPSKSGKDTKSYRAMAALAVSDDAVRETLAEDTKQAAVLGFTDGPEEGDLDNKTPSNLNGTGSTPPAPPSGPSTGAKPTNPEAWWEKKLSRTAEGAVKPDITNAVLILANHSKLQGIRYCELSGAVEVDGDLPWSRPSKYWRDADSAQLYVWVADNYGVQFSQARFNTAFSMVVDGRRYNPLTDYLDALPDWDGTERVSTLLIDYLGADDTDYVRAVTRATLVGMIKRAYEPGCKHDTVLVLDGAPGIGKSTLIRNLGGDWFSDSLSLADTRDKTAAEKIQGVWTMEIGEMQGTRKADVDVLKGFLSRQTDDYRSAYGRVVERHPRTTVIFGTTNSTDGFLRDTTGNRRFWPVKVHGAGGGVLCMTEADRAQILAEAKAAYLAGEHNYLTPEMEAQAREAQADAMAADDREGLVRDYLATPIPADYYSWDLERKMGYYQLPSEYKDEHKAATDKRPYVCPLEIWVECFGRPIEAWKRSESYDISAMMARIHGWQKTGERKRIKGYGLQRVYINSDCHN